MTLIKISNLRLRFQHPIILNPEKKYKLGVSHMMFSLDTAIDITFKIETKVPLKDITSEVFIAPLLVNQKMTIYNLRDYLQKFIHETYANVVQE